jgi:drug/metabolite transporter (DMT)-like permease
VSPPRWPSERTVVVGGFAVLVVLIGANLVAIRAGSGDLAPFWYAAVRFLVAAVLLAAIALWRRAPRPDLRSSAGAALYGVLAFAAFFGFLYSGLVRASVGLATTVLALGPLITLGMAAVVGLERLHWPAVVGGLIAFAGIAVIYGAEAGNDVPISSLLLLVAAAVSFAAAGILVKRMPRGDAVVQNAIATGVGAVILLALSFAAGEHQTGPTRAGTWIALVYLVVPGTVVTFLLLLYLLHRWPASTVSYQFVLAPIVAIALAAILLAEPIRPIVIVGTVLVIVGVWLGALRPTARAG